MLKTVTASHAVAKESKGGRYPVRRSERLMTSGTTQLTLCTATYPTNNAKGSNGRIQMNASVNNPAVNNIFTACPV